MLHTWGSALTDAIDLCLVLIGDVGDRRRHGEHDVEVGRRQQLGLAGGELLMSESGQSLPSEERCPNDRFPIRKRPLREVPVNGRSWPNTAVGALRPLRSREAPSWSNSSLRELLGRW